MTQFDLTEEQARELAGQLKERDDTSDVRTVVCSGWAVAFDIAWEGYTIQAEIHEPHESEGVFLKK